MPLDGIFLSHVINEIKKDAVGSRIEKVHQPTKDELVLFLRSREGSKKLLISSNAVSARIHLTEISPDNPKNPTMLCMLFRKHMTGAIIKDIRQVSLDRILFIEMDATNEIGDRVSLVLVVEIMSKHSNIILLKEDGKIIDSVKRVDLTQSSVRQVLPSLQYELPPSQNKTDIRSCDIELLIENIFHSGGKLLSSALLSAIEGISPLVSREICEKSAGADIAVSELTVRQKDKLREELYNLKNTAAEFTGTPVILIDKDKNLKDFSYMDITQYGFSYKRVGYPSFSLLLDKFYADRDTMDKARHRAADLLRLLDNTASRIMKKLVLQENELLECAQRKTLRINAELINANQSMLKKGCEFYDIENYYDNNNLLRIKANPALSPQENSQKYYKEYRKLKTAEQLLDGLIEKGREELLYIESVTDLLKRSTVNSEIDEIRNELKEQGYLRKFKNKKEKAEKPLPPIEYMTSDGFKVLVGRNNIQNDKLSMKIARGSDMWLHVQKAPGSHVIILSDNMEISDEAIVEAAKIAAYHSSLRNSGLAVVDYTYAKFIKKPPGAKPGKVIYNTYYSLNVTV